MPKQQNTMMHYYISNQISEAQRVMLAMLADEALLATVEEAANVTQWGQVFNFELVAYLCQTSSALSCWIPQGQTPYKINIFTSF